MNQAFIIMQIGNEQLDTVCQEAIIPALKANDLEPKRVDKHNQGGLLKSEIIRFIETSDIIVADLTNERQNCYLEIGYAMGIDKFRNLILTAREDHNPDSPNYRKGAPKIHFDLSGYDILFWHPDDLGAFLDELSRRIRRRLTILAPPSETGFEIWDDEWLSDNRERALAGLAEVGLPGFMELRYALATQKISAVQNELYAAADMAQIETFDWPIGAILNTPDSRPRPRADGIVSEISIRGRQMLSRIKNSYDYWTLRKNGDFYLLKNLFEDDSGTTPGTALYFNSRIVRVTEALLHCARLYSNLGVQPTSQVEVAIRHGGLRGRRLASSASDRIMFRNPATEEDELEILHQFRLYEIESRLVEFVKIFTSPLFMLFDFYEFADEVYNNIVNQFVAGKVT
jgi:hypothetical protein